MIRTIVLACLLGTTAIAEPFGPVQRVLDGDTYEISATWLPPELGNTLDLRIIGIDTPEHGGRAQCPREATLADRATAFVEEKLATSRNIEVKLLQWDKYGGRVNGLLFVDGKSIGALLIEEGLAYPYDGGTKRSWCDGD